MTFTFASESRFKVTAHNLPKDILWVKYESEWAKGKEDKLRKKGREDGLTD